MAKLKPLIEPDTKQCQVEKISYSPFRMGGDVRQIVRCTNKPILIATEPTPGDDGRVGSMSICAECKVVVLEQVAQKKLRLPIFTPLPAKGKDRASSR